MAAAGETGWKSLGTRGTAQRCGLGCGPAATLKPPAVPALMRMSGLNACRIAKVARAAGTVPTLSTR